MPGTPFIEYLEDCDGWDEASGQPGLAFFANAVQVWAIAQNRAGVTVAEAALAFNVKPALIRQAVDNAQWMFLSGDTIEHEGE